MRSTTGGRAPLSPSAATDDEYPTIRRIARLPPRSSIFPVSKGNLHKLGIFGTPLFVFETLELPGNADLVTRILDERGKTATIQAHQIGGWHSSHDLAKRPELCFQMLFQGIADRTTAAIGMLAEEGGLAMPGQLRCDVEAWATVMGSGDYVIPHDHPEAHFSAIFYADAGDTDVPDHPESGGLVLLDPRRGTRPLPGLDLFPQRFMIKPKSQLLAIFPSYLQHYVHPYRGKRPRVAISANVVIV